MAQSAKTIACELGPMRNQRGTGHGRAVPPDVALEHGLIACDAACLWCRWALRRLGPYILGDVSALVNDLQQGVTFYRGDLAQRLVAVDVQRLPDEQAHLLGTAVGRRAVGGTFLVQDEGVDAAADAPDAWPSSYRTGLIEGLLFSENGTLTALPKTVASAADLLASHPDTDAVLARLNELAATAVWTAPTGSAPATAAEVLDTIGHNARRLPEGLRPTWQRLGECLAR
jgi:hypothetical protein